VAWLHVLVLTSAVSGQAQVPAGSPVADAKKSGSAQAAPTGQKTPGSAATAAEKSPLKPTGTPPQPAAAKAATGPRVLTRAEMEKPRSPFLTPPSTGGAEADRYSPGSPDWSELPPWRRTSFFGIRAPGRFFVYVIDCSESMIDDDRLARATIELRRSVLALQAPQQFEVIFFNDESIPMPGGPRPRPADQQTKSQLLAWLRLIEPESGTDPRLALRQALSLRPEAVFLLSDGEFPNGTVAEVARLNTRQIPIHCVDLSGGLGGAHLKRIAHDSGGQYASRPGSLQGTP
jgi:hypothetical protein